MISIEVDSISYNGLKKDLEKYGKDATAAIKRAIDYTGLRIETIAKERLKGLHGSLKHWITGRLASSVHYEAKGKNTFAPNKYSEAGDGKLDVIITDDLEAVVGTNVEYAAKLEFEYETAGYLRYAALQGEKILEDRIEKELNAINK